MAMRCRGRPAAVPTPASARGTLIPALIIALLALTVRLVYLGEIRDIGFIAQPVSDGETYYQRAREIAGGDWLGSADFVHAPLYAYCLGVINLTCGDSPWPPRIAQALGGAVACVLVLLTARRLFDPAVAWVAAIMLALFPPAIFFDGLIQKAGLTLLLSTLLLWSTVHAAARPSVPRWGISGVAAGLLILTRQNALVLVPLLLAWLWWGTCREATSIRKARWVAATLVGLLLMLFPWALRNRIVTGQWILTTPNLGQNFAMGNHPEATGTYLPFRRGRATAEHEQTEWVRAAEQAVGRPLTAREVSDYYLDAALDWIRSHPTAWLRLTARKILMVWNAYETPDTEDYYLYCERATLLRWLDHVWHFGVLAPLAVAGLVLTFGTWRRLWALYTWLALITLAVAAFVVFARYRQPLVPVLVMFAAAGLVTGAGQLRQRSYRRLILPGVLAALTALAVNYPVHEHRRPVARSYSNHAVVLADQQRYDEALSELERAFALAPADVDTHFIAGSVLLELGRFDDALTQYTRARDGDSQYAAAHRGIGDALTGLGRLDEATEHYARAVELDADDHVSLNCLAANLARRGRYGDALYLFNQALTLAPDYAEAYLNLGNTYLALGRTDEAVAAYQHALELEPDYVDALRNLRVVEITRGRSAATQSKAP